ncbi:hypothetical protein AMELA_G00099580 [Ameiurus melas]|uniref:Fibronectin type-III domain-containing protein n=1 Tax=Ameiurus melas TaxID=219545 RepID=A0A7J6AW98_AMEME|nr:hypothetical protein AMELA_G00099580 [Ameiurus melas]
MDVVGMVLESVGTSKDMLNFVSELLCIYICFAGEVELNPPKPTVNQQPVDVGRLTRTVTGESFILEEDAPSNFPPNKITDLTVEIQEDTMHLSWTAPGEDYDEGTAQSYEIRRLEDVSKQLQQR